MISQLRVDRIKWITLVFVVAAAIGCDGEQQKIDNTVVRDGQPGVTTVDDENPKMKAAIATARQTVDQFIEALKQPPAGANGLSIKAEIGDGNNSEFMWLVDVKYRDGKFEGVLGNEPFNVKGVKLGDSRSVPKEDIADWMYIQNGKLVGGYTMRALRELMTPAEKAEFDQEVPFKLE